MQIKIARVRKRKRYLNYDEELNILSYLIKKLAGTVSLKKFIITATAMGLAFFLINSGIVGFSYNVFLNGERIGTVKDTAILEKAYDAALGKGDNKINNKFFIYPSLCFMRKVTSETELCENIMLSGGGYKKGFALKIGEETIFLARDEQIILALINKFENQNKTKLEGDFKIEYGIFKTEEKNSYEKALEKLNKTMPETSEEEIFIKPVVAEVSSFFGERWGREHKGIDFAANEGDSIVAADEGTVKFSGYEESFGNFVIIEHTNGYDSYYAHMSKRMVNEGDIVLKGQKIGEVGSTGNSTGPHLHFEIRLNGEAVNPAEFIAF